MPSTSQSLDLNEQDGKEVARRETSDKIVALPPRTNHSTLEARDPNPVLYDSFKPATCIQSQPRSLSSDGKVLATQKAAEEAPYQVSKGGRRRCGLQPKWFWSIVILAATLLQSSSALSSVPSFIATKGSTSKLHLVIQRVSSSQPTAAIQHQS